MSSDNGDTPQECGHCAISPPSDRPGHHGASCQFVLRPLVCHGSHDPHNMTTVNNFPD